MHKKIVTRKRTTLTTCYHAVRIELAILMTKWQEGQMKSAEIEEENTKLRQCLQANPAISQLGLSHAKSRGSKKWKSIDFWC